MCQVKKTVMLFLAVIMLATVPLSAYALPAGGYVPTKGKFMSYQDGKWVTEYEIRMSYMKDGRITKYVYVDPDGTTSKITYKWKGDYIAKKKYWDGDYIRYVYKNGKRVKFSEKMGNTLTRITYKWKGRKASGNDGEFSDRITVNRNNRLVKIVEKRPDEDTIETITRKYTYYTNGNLKTETTTSEGYFSKAKYNKKGYIKKETYKEGDKVSTYTYTYRFKQGKILEQYCVNDNDGEISKSKTVYSKWKAVSHVRNCDAYAVYSPLG